MSAPRLLLTLADVAHPLDGGNRLRAAPVLRALSEVGDVDVVVLHSSAPPGDGLTPGVVVARSARLPDVRRGRVRGLGAFLAGVPGPVATRDWEPARRLVAAWSLTPYDLVWFGALDHALRLRRVVQAARTVVDVGDVESVKLRALQALDPPGPVRRLQQALDVRAWERAEDRVRRTADAAVVCSELDRERFGGPRTSVVPNTYPDPGLQPLAPRGPVRMLYVANFEYAPNVDAASWAAREVLPRVRALRPDAELHLVGRRADLVARFGVLPGVVLRSDVPEVLPELRAATASLAAVRWGGGTRLKIVEAFAAGVPVVSTALACEGLPVVDGEHLLLVGDADEAARACVRVSEDEQLAASLAVAGRALYEATGTPAVAQAAVTAVATQVLAREGVSC
ncbi:MAG: glycosyl transferase group 1 [Frankiales bacterium]|nr:glycosyl transferase group 1 [Frankiales bacterium]